MPVLKIATYPDEETLLRSQSEPILKITGRIQQLIDNMIETMYEAVGVGLAAPQVFVSKRLFVYDVGDGAEALINPEIVERDGEEVGVEGCLSIPRLQGDVLRAQKVVVTGLNRRGRPVKIPAEGYLARVFQHEIDHLNGRLFIDLADPKTLEWLSEEDEDERRRDGRRGRGRGRRS